VQPILLYCSEVWSLFTLIKEKVNVELKYDSFIPNKVQMKYAKYILGVHKSATHIAVLAELGLYPLSIAALKSSVIYWIHLLNSKYNSLIFHAYRENLTLNESLCNKLKHLFSIIGFSYIWNSTLTFPFIKVNSDQTSLQYKRIGCAQALKSLICPYIFILSDNKDLCMQNIALHAFFDC
jgi:hypothetical protein